MAKEKTNEEIKKGIQEAFPNLDVSVKDDEVYASAKSLEVNAFDLVLLSKLIGGRKITFGRTGPKFRLIISKPIMPMK